MAGRITLCNALGVVEGKLYYGDDGTLQADSWVQPGGVGPEPAAKPCSGQTGSQQLQAAIALVRSHAHKSLTCIARGRFDVYMDIIEQQAAVQ